MNRFQQLQEIAGPVSRETYLCLETFENEFQRWSARINLAAPSTLPDVWERHLLDSAQLIKIAPTAKRWLDLGTGGGFPGAILAILMRDRGGHVDLVESNRKKAAFLQTVLAKTEAAGKVHARRIDQAVFGQPEIVTARALAPLPLLLQFSSRWLLAGAHGLFHKGRGYRAELDEIRDHWAFNLIEHPSSASGDGVILEISQMRRL